MDYALKEIPEDFIVEEIDENSNVIDEDFFETVVFDENREGRFLICVLKKIDRDMIYAIRKISKKLNISSERIGVAGFKDRKAITYQRISLMDVKKEEIDQISKELEEFRLYIKPYRYSENKVYLGNLKYNRFTIVVRNIDYILKDKLKDLILMKLRKNDGYFPNFYGEQRFSGGKSIEIGINLIMGNLENALKKFLEGDKTPLEYEIIRVLKNTNDYVKAFNLIPLSLRKMYVFSVQSLIFNKVLEKYIQNNEKWDYGLEIPLVGYNYENKIIKKDIDFIVDEVLKEMNIKPGMFKIEYMEEISSKGSMRKGFSKIHDFEILEIKEDDIYDGKVKIKIRFKLCKGSYATEAIKYLFE